MSGHAICGCGDEILPTGLTGDGARCGICAGVDDDDSKRLQAEFNALSARLAAAERELDAERAAGAALAGRLGEVQAKADCAERDRDEFDRQRKLYHSDMMAVREQRDAAERRAEEAERERDEARTTINLVREVVEEMRVDAARPKGGQSVGMRRMPVALSVVLELQGLLGPERAAYTNKTWMEERAAREAAERRAEEARNALREMRDVHLFNLYDAVMREADRKPLIGKSLAPAIDAAARALGLRSPGDPE